jgi:hypothetical protein
VKKGTVWFFSDIVVAVTSMIMTLFMLFVAALLMFTLNSQLDVNVIGGLMYDTPKADNTLLTFLDSTSGEHSMKELMAYAVMTGNTTFTLDGKDVDLKAGSRALMDRITPNAYKLALVSGGMAVTLAESGKPESVDNIKTEAAVQAGAEEGKMMLIISE